MNAAAADHPHRAHWPWLLLIALLSGAALVAVLVLQWRQVHGLTRSLDTPAEVQVVQMHRQETEYLQLCQQWEQSQNSAMPLDRNALVLRYDVWVGRFAMLREDTPMSRIARDAFPQLGVVVRDVEAFVRAADAVFAAEAEPAQLRARLKALQPQLLALGDPIHDLALAASHMASAEQTERTLVLSQFSRVTLALTALLALMVLAFAGLALGQMRQLARRHAALQALTADLHAARRTAESNSQAKSRFLANMSHEIRTPFQGLIGMLSMLRDTNLDARQVDYLRTATESADHLLAVLNDVLDMSQLEAGRLQVTPSAVTLRSMLQDVEALMRPQAGARNLALHVHVEPAVPERVRADATRVKQVLFNLLSNAIKFSQHGSIDLELRVQDDESGGARLLFIVSDTGMGMDNATLARLFERFERGGASMPGSPGGSGLGLEISRSLARLMGGDVLVSSQPGQGSRFTFVLPVEAVAPGEWQPPVHDPSSTPPTLLEILVAEDHSINRQVLAALLESMGHHPIFVATGSEALAAVQARRFDLVLMDLHMPGLDGIEATRRIRALPDRAAATVPIVALTADAFTDTRERCLVAGMNHFLTKPVSREKLAALLRQLFGHHTGTDPQDSGESLAGLLDGPDADALPLIDRQVVNRTLQVLPAERYAAMLSQYLDQGPGTVDRLRKAVRDAQPLELRVHAHSARSAALTLGLTALAATAEALQNGAAHLPAHEVARLVQRFDELLAATRAQGEREGLLGSAVTR